MNTKINEILQEIESVIVGKNEIVEKILMAILAQGHVLMEDVPGVGKTPRSTLFPYTTLFRSCKGPWA